MKTLARTLFAVVIFLGISGAAQASNDINDSYKALIKDLSQPRCCR